METKYLKEKEIYNESVIVIDFEDGRSEPYFVIEKRLGNISGATMLLGEKMSLLLEMPHLINQALGGTDRYYIENDKTKGKNKGVNGYRLLNEKEMDHILEKLRPVSELSKLVSILEKQKVLTG